MSIESAKAYMERLKDDEDFRTSVGEIATSEERMEFAKAQGFDFTNDEIATVKDELSGDDLEQVAGGGGMMEGSIVRVLLEGEVYKSQRA